MFHLYGLSIGVGLLLGIFVAQKKATHFKINQKLLEDSLVWIAFPALVGARLYHLSTDWHLYEKASFLEIISIWNGGLGLFGALLGGLVGVALFSVVKTYKQKKTSFFLSFFTVLDLLSFGAPIAQVIGRFGNYFNQELYGFATTLPWGIFIKGEKYHPLFAYEALGTLSIFFLLHWMGNKKKFPIGKGQYACMYFTLYAVLRFWLEFLRIETARMSGLFGFFSTAQWVCVLICFISISIFWLRRHSDRGIEWELQTLL